MLPTRAIVAAVLLYVNTLSTAQVDLKTCGDKNSDITCSFFFSKIDEAFRQRDILYTLRKTFFPNKGARPILIDTSMTLEIMKAPAIACKDEDYAFGDNLISNVPSMEEVCESELYECGPYSLQWRHQWSKTILTYIIEREDLELLQDTNFVAFSAATFNSFDTSVFSSDEDGLPPENSTNSSGLSEAGKDTMKFLVTIDFLPCRPDDNVLLEAWEDILPWLGLYSMNSDNLENVEYTQEGRGYAFREGRSRHGGLTIPMISTIHILLNTVFALAATYFLYKYHSELNQTTGKQYQVVASMYWSVVLMSLIGATVIIVGNCYLYYALLFIDDRSLTVFGFRIASDITVGVAAVIELFVSMLTPHDPAFFIPHIIRRTLCCNQCCRCCGSESRRNILRRCILGVAMWIIIVFLQLVVSSILPLAVVVITNPVPSLAYISIMIALFFCLVVFVAYFLNAIEGDYIARHRLPKDDRRKSDTSLSSLIKNPGKITSYVTEKLFLVAQAFVFLVIFAIVSLVIILYLNFVKAGANTNTVGGLFFSLVPSAVLGGITWAAKRHMFKELEDEEDEEESKAPEEVEDTKETVLRIGGISWHRASRKRLSTTKGKTNSKTALDVVIEMDDKTCNNVHAQGAMEGKREITDSNGGKSISLCNYATDVKEDEEEGTASDDHKGEEADICGFVEDKEKAEETGMKVETSPDV